MRRLASAMLGILLVAACSTPPGATPSAVAAAPSESPGDPLVALLHAAAGDTIDAGTASIEWTMAYRGSTSAQFPDGPYASATGSVSFGEPRHMVIDARSRAAGLGSVRIILLQDLLLIPGQFFEAAVAPGKWLLVDLNSADPRAASYRILTRVQREATFTLYYLYGATGIRNAGAETLDGVTTTHYDLRLDLDLAVEEAPEAIRETLSDYVTDGKAAGWEPILDADVWVDGDGLIRAADTVLFVDPQVGVRQELMTFRFDDLGEPLDLDIPPDGDIVYLEDVPTDESAGT